MSLKCLFRIITMDTNLQRKLTHFLCRTVGLIMVIPICSLLLLHNIWVPFLKVYFSYCQPRLKLTKKLNYSFQWSNEGGYKMSIELYPYSTCWKARRKFVKSWCINVNFLLSSCSLSILYPLLWKQTPKKPLLICKDEKIYNRLVLPVWQNF